MEKMTDKVALVTGTSTGLGMRLALRLAGKGVRTYAAMRDVSKKDILEGFASRDNTQVEIVPLDVEDTNSVNSCIHGIIRKESKIDYLINNAGIAYTGTTEFVSEEEFDKIIDVNVKGVFRCVKAVLPYMRSQKYGRIINISSINGLIGTPFGELYCGSKFWLEGYTESLASYIQPEFNIKFTIVEPGLMRTELESNTLSGNALHDTDDYKNIIRKIARNKQKSALKPEPIQLTDEVAEIIIECLQSENPPLRLRTSDWAEEICSLKTASDPSGEKLLNQVIEWQFGCDQIEKEVIVEVDE